MIKDRNLKIILDMTTLINHGPDIGAGRYILNLVKGLLSLKEKTGYIFYGTYHNDQYLPIIDGLKKDFPEVDISLKFIKIGKIALKIQERLRFPPIEFFGLKADILHAMDYVIPPTLNKNIVLTIHDLAFMRFPEFNFKWFIEKYRHMVESNAVMATKILASSQSTADDIHNYFKTDMDKIKAVHLAAGPDFRKLASNEIDCSIPKCFKISGPFLFSVGTIEPRKDFATLIKAYEMARDRDNGFRYQLVVAGRTGWKSEKTFEARKTSPYRNDIVFTGRLSDRELIQLYNLADIFVYTSLFEGFGFPLLEAMGCGLPVICSDSSSMKEVVHNAGILVQPGDVEGFSDCIMKIYNDKKIKEDLSRKSLKRVKDFTWQKTAEKTLSAYKEAASAG